MKKAFSLLEVIFVIVVISIITTFIVFNSNNFLKQTTQAKIKSQIALIKTSISKHNTKLLLLQKESLEVLDNEIQNSISDNLFSNVLDYPLQSTTNSLKKTGLWIKTSSNTYKIYLDKENFLDFVYEDGSFICKSQVNLCKEYE